jgi:hypothetical protein
MTLEQFETLVLSQQAAVAPWQPVTDYSFEARKAIEGQHPQLIKDVFALDICDIVIDAGCGPDGVLVKLLAECGLTAIGFDPQIHQTLDRRLMYGDLLEPGQDGALPFATLVICREVLEHLTVRHVRQAVTHLCALSKHYVYVTTRFAKAPQSLLDVDTSDDLDPTHITMLNQDFLRVLFVLEGFKRRADLEAKMDWQGKGRVLVYERVA